MENHSLPSASKQNLLGIINMIIATFLFSVIALFINKLSSELSILLILTLSTMVSAGVMLGWALVTRGKYLAIKTNISIYLLRGICSGIGALLWVKVLRLIPVTDATALSYTTPLLNIIIAIILLKEKLTLARLAAIIAAIAGVLIILKPNFSANYHGYAVALFNTIFWVIGDITAKIQSRYDRVITQCFYLFIFMALVESPILLVAWSPPSLSEWLYIFIIGLLQLFNLYSLFKAFACADMVTVVPFDTGRLIFTTSFAYLFFAEVISFSTFIGALIIIGSLLYLAKSSIKTN